MRHAAVHTPRCDVEELPTARRENPVPTTFPNPTKSPTSPPTTTTYRLEPSSAGRNDDDDKIRRRDSEPLLLDQLIVRQESSTIMEENRSLDARTQSKARSNSLALFDRPSTASSGNALLPRAEKKWDPIWGPPVPYDPRYPNGQPPRHNRGSGYGGSTGGFEAADEWDEFFGPPVRKGQGGRLWAAQPAGTTKPPPHHGMAPTPDSTRSRASAQGPSTKPTDDFACLDTLPPGRLASVEINDRDERLPPEVTREDSLLLSNLL